MTTCRYFLQGNCRAGLRCRFEHVRPNDSDGGFASKASFQSRNSSTSNTPQVTPEHIRLDMTEDRPIWPLSAYGYYKGLPCCVIGVDFSQEEARLECMMELRSTGTISQYRTHMSELLKDMETCIDTLKRQPKSAIDGKIITPGTQSRSQFGAFGNGTVTNGNVFGKSAFQSKPVNGTDGNNTFGVISNSSFNSKTVSFGSSQQQQPQSSPFGLSNRFGALDNQMQSTNPSPFSNTSFQSIAQSNNNNVITSQGNAFGSHTNSAFGRSVNGPSTQSASSFGSVGLGAKSIGQVNTGGSSGFQSAFQTSSALSGNQRFGMQPSTFESNLTQQPSGFGVVSSQLLGNMNPSFAAQSGPANHLPVESSLDPSLQKAFAAPRFELGGIPEVEPPLQFR